MSNTYLLAGIAIKSIEFAQLDRQGELEAVRLNSCTQFEEYHIPMRLSGYVKSYSQQKGTHVDWSKPVNEGYIIYLDIALKLEANFFLAAQWISLCAE